MMTPNADDMVTSMVDQVVKDAVRERAEEARQIKLQEMHNNAGVVPEKSEVNAGNGDEGATAVNEPISGFTEDLENRGPQLETDDGSAAKGAAGEPATAPTSDEHPSEVQNVPDASAPDASAPDTSAPDTKAAEENVPEPKRDFWKPEQPKRLYNYSWTQSTDTVQVVVPIKKEYRARDMLVDVDASNGKLLISHKSGQTLLEGSLCGIVSNSGLTWQIEGEGPNKSLLVEMEKGSSSIWPNLLENQQPVHVHSGTQETANAAPEGEGKTDTEKKAEDKAEAGSAGPTGGDMTKSEATEDKEGVKQQTDDSPQPHEGEEDIIELDTRDMQKKGEFMNEIEEERLAEELMDSLVEEQMMDSLVEDQIFEELEREIGNRGTEDRIASDASMHGGEPSILDLIEYYKAVALEKTHGSESPDLAAMQVALFYSRGIFVKQDYKEAAKWYNLAAAKGNDVAMFHLGLIYQEGLGVEADPSKALEWWQKAADKGNANATYNLGVIYINGHGVKQDVDKAIQMFSKAKELDPNLPFPPFEEGPKTSARQAPPKPLTEEEKKKKREDAIQNLRYVFWTTTILSAAAVTFVGVRYWWKNRL